MRFHYTTPRFFWIIIGGGLFIGAGFLVLPAFFSSYIATRVAPGLSFKILSPATLKIGEPAVITWYTSPEGKKQYPFEKIEFCSGKKNTGCITLKSTTPNNGKAIIVVPQIRATSGYIKLTARDSSGKMLYARSSQKAVRVLSANKSAPQANDSEGSDNSGGGHGGGDGDNNDDNDKKTNTLVFFVRDYGANLTDNLPDDAAFSQCLQNAMRTGVTCFIDAGQLTLSIYAPELRNPSGANIDARGLTITGTGDNTVIKGISAKGFDVFQLDRISNITIRNLLITAEKTTADQTQGVNGISMTNGTSNIAIDNVTVRNLPHVIKSNYIDGGKAFTVQTGANPVTSSTNISIRNSRSIHNPIGFTLDSNPNLGAMPGTILFTDNVIKDAATGVSISFSAKAGGGTDVPGFSANIANNHMSAVRHPLVIGRAPSIRFANNAISVSAEPSFADPSDFPYKKYPFFFLGAKDGNFTGNSINYALPSEALFLVGGAFNAAYTQNFVFKDNSIHAKDTIGMTMHNAGGISVKNSIFGCNIFSGISGSFYDPLLSLPVFENTVQATCN